MDDDFVVDAVVGGRYRVVRQLGEGGMSLVYEVVHTKLARSFALKRLRPALVENTDALERFELEAELLASLRHPNVVDISDWVVLDDGTPCMILEFLHGASLNVRLQRQALAWETIARMGDQAMSVLSLAHRMGITHRDLKPDNIFISIDDVGEERVKIVDFGVSKLRGSRRRSGQHEIVGTPAYMSPEQARGEPDSIGPSTDVWAMGAILFEMATQRVAFAGDNVAEVLTRIIAEQPDSVLKHRRDAPPAFVDLVSRAMSRDPLRRITSIEVLRDGLKNALSSPAPAVPVRTPRLSTQPSLARTLTPPAGIPASSSRTNTPSGTPVLQLATPDSKPIVTGTAIAPRDPRRAWTLGIVVAVIVTLLNVVIAIAL